MKKSLTLALAVAVPLTAMQPMQAQAGIFKWLAMGAMGTCAVSQRCIGKVQAMGQTARQRYGTGWTQRCANNPLCANFAQRVAGTAPTGNPYGAFAQQRYGNGYALQGYGQQQPYGYAQRGYGQGY